MDDIKRVVRVKLALAGVCLADVARSQRLDYSRLHRVIGGYAKPTPGEIDRLLRAIEVCGTNTAERDSRTPRTGTVQKVGH